MRGALTLTCPCTCLTLEHTQLTRHTSPCGDWCATVFCVFISAGVQFWSTYEILVCKKTTTHTPLERCWVTKIISLVPKSQTSSFGAGGGRTLAFSLAARRLALGELGGARRQ